MENGYIKFGKKVYDLEERVYDLRPSRIMNIIEQLAFVVRNHRDATGEICYLKGKDRKLTIKGCNVIERDYLNQPELADLVLSEDGQTLILTTKAQEAVTIDPSKLYDIGRYNGKLR